MNQTQASRVVFLVGAIMAVYVLLRANRGIRGDAFRSLWAIGVLTLGLAIAADFAPQVAGPFALLVGIAMVVRNSGEVGQVLSGRVAVAGGGSGYRPAQPSGQTTTPQGGPPRRR